MPSSMDVFSKGKNDFFPANQCSWSGSFPQKKSWIRNTAANMILFFYRVFRAEGSAWTAGGKTQYHGHHNW
jgi:hypothetical protein